MKTTIYILGMVFCFATCFSQQAINSDDHARQIIDNSTIIFEGKTLKQESYWNSKKNFIYTSNIIQVYKIFRGDGIIKTGTIDLITEGGTIGRRNMNIPGSTEIPGNSYGIFFCGISHADTFGIATNNRIHVGLHSMIVYDSEPLNPAAYGMGRTFKSIREVYDFIVQFGHISIANYAENVTDSRTPVVKKVVKKGK